jgi:hypothetical protein
MSPEEKSPEEMSPEGMSPEGMSPEGMSPEEKSPKEIFHMVIPAGDSNFELFALIFENLK